jgi:uncharacterized surface protein with fasciclin (FAS1) repeats
MQPNRFIPGLVMAAILSATISCSSDPATNTEAAAASNESPVGGGQSNVQDNESQKNIVQVAASSKDHTTLVTAVKAAELVDVLSNAGPFTVFAPVNAAFDKLPAGTVDGLLKPEKKADLQNILQYHVSIGVFKLDNLTDGQVIGQANGDNIKVTVRDGKFFINGNSEIISSIPVSNGLIHVVNEVLLPPTK